MSKKKRDKDTSVSKWSKKKNVVTRPAAHLKQPLIDLTPEASQDMLQKLGIVLCDQCGMTMRVDRYEEHCQRRHSGINTNFTRKKKTVSGRQIMIEPDRQEKTSKCKTSKCKTKKRSISKKRTGGSKRILLADKWGIKINEFRKCSSCNERVKPVWHYPLSNWGEVDICAKCKSQVLEDSFGKKDALDHAFQGGMFGGNRRRH